MIKNPDIARCGAKSRQHGGPCKLRAGHGTDHPGFGLCRMHGGNVAAHKKRAAELEMIDMGRVMGMPIDVDPVQALLNVIRMTAGEVEYATLMVAGLSPDQAVETFTEEQSGSEISYTKTTNVATLNIWIRTRHDAMDRLARYAKMAIDAGVAERQVRVAERMGGMLGNLITAVLGELKLSPAQAEIAPMVVQRQLALVAGGAATT